MTTQSKIISTVIGFMLLAGVGCSKIENSFPTAADEPDIAATSTTQSPSATLTKPAVRAANPAIKPAINPPGAAPLSYVQALNQYRTQGAYFQFVKCRGNPGSLSLKQGTKLMFDNRDTVAHRIGIDKLTTYHVDPYGFAVISAPVAGQYYITCDGGGAALLNVES